MAAGHMQLANHVGNKKVMFDFVVTTSKLKSQVKALA